MTRPVMLYLLRYFIDGIESTLRTPYFDESGRRWTTGRPYLGSYRSKRVPKALEGVRVDGRWWEVSRVQPDPGNCTICVYLVQPAKTSNVTYSAYFRCDVHRPLFLSRCSGPTRSAYCSTCDAVTQQGRCFAESERDHWLCANCGDKHYAPDPKSPKVPL